MKATLFIFILAMLGAGPVFAEERTASPSRKSPTAEPGFNLDYGHNQIAEVAVGERIIDRYISFDPSEVGGSSRYSMSLDLEHEADDWNFEITVTIEF